MADAAAFFDLDRTLLLGASGPVISDGLRRSGVVTREEGRIERFLFGVFNVVGETLPSMLIGRQGARAAKGWRQEEVRAVGREVAPALAELIEPYALQAIEGHRSAGRKVVLATTTPLDVIEPLAELLGLDGVLATRYRVGDDGCYDGSIDGEFVWSRGKARSAVCGPGRTAWNWQTVTPIPTASLISRYCRKLGIRLPSTPILGCFSTPRPVVSRPCGSTHRPVCQSRWVLSRNRWSPNLRCPSCFPGSGSICRGNEHPDQGRVSARLESSQLP